MTDDKCPECGKRLEFLGGAPAHPSNRYCPDEEGCGYKAWKRPVRHRTEGVPTVAQTLAEKADEADRLRTRLQRAEELLTDIHGALDRLSRLGADQSEAVSKIDSIDAFLGERHD